MMAHILADLFQIEMFQTTVSQIMKKYQDEHDFCFGHGRITMIFAFCGWLKCIFCIMASKNLQDSSARQNNSITLLSVIIAIIISNPL